MAYRNRGFSLRLGAAPNVSLRLADLAKHRQGLALGLWHPISATKYQRRFSFMRKQMNMGLYVMPKSVASKGGPNSVKDVAGRMAFRIRSSALPGMSDKAHYRKQSHPNRRQPPRLGPTLDERDIIPADIHFPHRCQWPARIVLCRAEKDPPML